MYELKPESIFTFVTDHTIKLPRFQRKSSWSAEQNFNLAVSLFKGFPLGMVVVKREGTSSAGQRFLLDGRQRRQALRSMRQPDEIYDWAKGALGLLNADTSDDIQKKFLTYLINYFGTEDWEATTDPASEAIGGVLSDETGSVADLTADIAGTGLDESEPEIAGGADGSEGEGPADPDEPEGDVEVDAASPLDEAVPDLDVASAEVTAGPLGDLEDLLRAIELVHPRRGRWTGFSRAFDFNTFLATLSFVRTDDKNKLYVNTEQVRNWVQFKKEGSESGNYPPSQDEFYEWLTSDTEFKPGQTEAKLRQAIAAKWDDTRAALQLLDGLDRRLRDGVIGYLEIRGSSANDDSKVFEIINTAGTPLTAAEILSAKPSWNVQIEDAAEKIGAATAKLYGRMGITLSDLVRWDDPATLIDRVDAPVVFGGLADESARGFERKVTLGFKLLAGFYGSGISKDQIAELPTKAIVPVPWGTLEFESLLSQTAKTIESIEHFGFWKSWNLSLIAGMSDAVAMNFLLMMAKDWDRRGRPTNPASGTFKAFAKNAIVLLDRSIFEYVSGAWRGSGDSRIATNLAAMSSTPELFSAVPADAWSTLVNEIVDDGTIRTIPYTARQDPRVVLLLYYRNVVLYRLGPDNTAITVHVDHIVPRVLFDAEADPQIVANRHHIANLSLLPAKDNLDKLGHRLSDLPTDGLLAQRIAQYEDVAIADFGKFSNPASTPALRGTRGELLRHDLTEVRHDRVSNPSI